MCACVYVKFKNISYFCSLNALLLDRLPREDAVKTMLYSLGSRSFQYVANDENGKCFAKLLVNGTMAVTGEQILPQRGMVPKYANLYIGGIPLTFSYYFPPVAMGFIGCMDSLKVDLQQSIMFKMEVNSYSSRRLEVILYS